MTDNQKKAMEKVQKELLEMSQKEFLKELKKHENGDIANILLNAQTLSLISSIN